MTDLRRNPCPACRRRHRGEPGHRLRWWCLHEGPGRASGLHPRAARPGTRRDRPFEPIDRPLLVYLFDPYCPWSYGYLPALAQLLGRVGAEVDLEVVNVGLHSDTPISDAPPPMLAIQRCTGVGFGPGYRRALADGSMPLSSRDAAAAVVALLAADPSRPIDVLWAVHRAFFWSGQSLSEPATVARIARRLGLDAAAVQLFAGSAKAGQLADEDFHLARDLGARRGPTLLVSHGEHLAEFEGPGVSGDHLLQQFRSVLARP